MKPPFHRPTSVFRQYRALILGACIAASLPTLADAQQPVPENRRRLLINSPSAPAAPLGNAPAKAEEPYLSTNYRLTLAAKTGDKPLGELSTLTCAREIGLSGPIDTSETPASFTVRGNLAEKDSLIIFSYSIGFSVPVTTASLVPAVIPKPAPGAGNAPASIPAPNTMRSVQYQQHESTGTLRMKPGQSYDVLKVGGNVYTLTIAPEGDAQGSAKKNP